MAKKVYEEEKISAIAQAIRQNTGTDNTYTTSEMPNGINEVYQNGEKAMLNAMWEALQGGGRRTNYSSSFFEGTTFTKKTFKPIYDIRPTSCNLWTRDAVPDKAKIRAEGQVNMIELEKEQGIVFDFSNVTNFTNAFSGGLFSHLSTIDLKSATVLTMIFYGGYLSGQNEDLWLKRIERLICYETNDLSQNCFHYQRSLTYIGFEGVIGKSVNLAHCPLVVESINKLFACLKDYSEIGGTYTVTLRADRENMLTAEEKAVATNKGWTLVWS